MPVALLIALLPLLLLAGAARAVDGPTTPILDDFNRPDENPLSQGGNWAPAGVDGGTPLLVNGNRAGNGTAGSSYRSAEVIGSMEAYAAIGIGPATLQSMTVLIALQDVGTSGWDGYALRVINVFSPNEQYRIRRITDGVPTDLAGWDAPLTGAGERLLLRKQGDTLEAWQSAAGGGTWTLKASATDSTYSGGRIGLQLTSGGSAAWDDFGGGGIGSTPPPPPEQCFGVTGGTGMWAKCGGDVIVADPVNTLTGAFVTQTQDLSLPGTGVAFDWTRSYTSGDPTVGPLGPGWTHNYAASLTIEGDGDVTARGEEGQQLFFAKQQDGSFVGAAGSLATLSLVGGVYRLVRNDQVTYEFDGQGVLTSIKDRNNQGVTFTYLSGRLTTVTDAAGRQATVSYNASNLVSQVSTEDGRSVSFGFTSGRLTSVTDVRGKQWTYTYDGAGRLATIVDPLNHSQVTNVYGADGRVQTQTDALGRTTTFAWDAGSQLATVTDANAKVWKDDYEDNILASRTDPLNNVTEFVHDADLNTTSVESPTNEQTTMTYDAAGNLLQATAPPSLGNAQKTFVYNTRNDPTQVTDARGKVTAYTYDGAGNVATVTQDGTQVAAYTYDPAGRVLTFTDGNEKTWTYTYTANGYLASSTDPLGNKTTYTYDGAGRLLTRVDPKGNCQGCTPADFTWSYTYNAAGQLLTETDPLGHTTTNAYDDAGRLTSATDANGHTTSYTYDDADRVLTETAPDPDGGGPLAAPVTTYTYDNVGNKLTETDPRGNTTTFAYDSANRLVSETGPDPDGGGPLTAPVMTQTYDANGNLASTVEPRGNAQGASPDDYRTIYTYDAAGRQLTETGPDPDGAGPQIAPVTTNVYDPVGNLQSVEDANDRTTSYTYDAAGRILTVNAPDAGATIYTYDDVGNVLTRRDDNNHTTTFAYDDAGRLISETGPDPDGAGSQTSALTAYTYDPNGNRLTLTDPNGNATQTQGDGRTTYGYDRANRLTSIDYSDSTPDVTFTYDDVGNRLTMVDGSGTQTRTHDNLDRLLSVTRGSDTFSYVYDAASNITRRTYPGGTIVDYGYDPLNRLSSVASGGQTTSYAYDVASNLTQTTLPGGHNVETRVYDRAARLTEVETKHISTVIARFLATLDPVGNPTQIVRTGALAETQTYTYDANDRILSVCFQAGSCPGGSDPFVRWTYDKVGNRLSEQRPTGTTSYTYDNADRLLSAGSASYTYDQNGNQTQLGISTLTYDLANRLKTRTHGNETTTYTYDGDGVRQQASTGSQASQKTNFLWDVNQALPQIALERDGANALLRRYVYGARRISMTTPSATSFFVYDGLGSVANVISQPGTAQKTYSYEPFGKIRTESGTGATNFMKFTGEYRDPTTLYHLRARQYDPSTGRFLRPDPAELNIDSALVASYVYVADRPTLMVDPSGEVFLPSGASLDAVGDAVSPTIVLAFPAPVIPDGSGKCEARPGYPLGVIGGFNGGRATHRAKNPLPAPWQSREAIDLNVPVGTMVCAIFKGRVSPGGWGFGPSSEGWRLHIVGASDIAFYTHLVQLAVKQGQPVEKGQLLGWSGCGTEGVPHLHLALRRGNPDRYAPPFRKAVNYRGCPKRT